MSELESNGARSLRAASPLSDLRQPVGNVVIVALVRDEDMLAQPRARRAFEGAHPDRDLVLPDRVPEQDRATGRAESAPDLFRRAIPAEMLGAGQGQRLARNVGRCPIVARLPAALRAVAGIGVGQRA